MSEYYEICSNEINGTEQTVLSPVIKEMNNLTGRVEAMISNIFGKYDMRKGENNKLRMQKLNDFCMRDIKEHPALVKELRNKAALEHFVVQSIIYMMVMEADTNG